MWDLAGTMPEALARSLFRHVELPVSVLAKQDVDNIIAIMPQGRTECQLER